jgi:hypothetical protein
METAYNRHAFGVSVRTTMIYERALELTAKLCWNSEDLGISRVHIHHDRTFRSVSALKKFCEESGDMPPAPRYFFDWLDPIKKYTGVARENYLRDEHWCNREQVVNIMLDTAMQAYTADCRDLLSAITAADFGNAELVKLDINNTARQYTGAPDSVFVDLRNKNIALIEIKIGKTRTQYSLGQSIKYETMSALLRTDEFFPDFHVHNVLLAPGDNFSQNASKAHLLGPSTESEGKIIFSYESTALTALKPRGHADVSTLLAARLQKLRKGQPLAAALDGECGISFYAWPTVEQICPDGLLKENIRALMGYLAPSQGEKDRQTRAGKIEASQR